MPNIRFHLDEHLPHALADALRDRGIDVTTSTDAGLLGANDPTQLDYALREGRVLVTRDSDFVRLARSGVDHAGIVFCPRRFRSFSQILNLLISIHDGSEAEDMLGRIEYA
jgi:uncharacterized protein with PIN domain